MQIRHILTEACCVLWVAGGMAYGATLDRTDSAFLNNAARIEMTEAHEGQLAQNQASRADVRDVGKALAQDYKASYSELAALAAKAGVSIPKGIDVSKDHTIEQLVTLKGMRFDRQFVRDEVTAQRNAIAVFRREAARGENADVKAYASKMIPAMERDLKRAETVANTAKRT